MSHFDYDDGLAYDDDPADFWDQADRAYEEATGK